MGVSNGQAGTILAVEKFVTLTKPLCLDTFENNPANSGLGFIRDGFPGDGWAVYPFQDQYGLNIRIPLTDFVFLANNVPATAPLDALGEATNFVAFNGPKEFAGPVTVTVFVERDPINDPGNFTQALTFSATMGTRRQATVKNQFAYLNSFATFVPNTADPPVDVLQDNATLAKRNQIVDNFHVNWNKSNLLLTLSGLRYHNFGENLNTMLIDPAPGPYNDIQRRSFLLKDGVTKAAQTGMQTIFDMDTNRGGFGFTDFPQNVRVKIDTSYTFTTKPPVVSVVTVKHTYWFSTSTFDDPEFATDMFFAGSSTLSAATVAGCDVPFGGLPFNKETERMTTRPTRLVPLLFDPTVINGF